jgi:hypothetical protein
MKKDGLLLKTLMRPLLNLDLSNGQFFRHEGLAGGKYEDWVTEQVGEFGEVISLGQSFTRMARAVQERDRFLEQMEALLKPYVESWEDI